MSSNEVEEKDKGGRPPEGIKFGQHKNAFGWDPVGSKQLKQDFDNTLNELTKALNGKTTTSNQKSNKKT